jgi:hypothetical protein
MFKSPEETNAYNLGLEAAATEIDKEIDRLRRIGRAWTKTRISEYKKRAVDLRAMKIRN